MSKRSGESRELRSQFGESESNLETQLGATKPSTQDETRRRLPTYKGYCNTLETKVAAFRKESIKVQKALEAVNNASEMSTLGAALGSLESIITPYQNIMTHMENFFIEDRWGVSNDIASEIRETGNTWMNRARDAIAKAVRNFSDGPGENFSVAGSKGSRRSNKTTKSGISSTSSARRMEAVAEVAAAAEQAEYDLLIATKEIARRQFEANEERRKAELKAQHDHEIAVLKAKKLTAVAKAKLTAIEQSIQQEELHSADQSDTESSVRSGKTSNSHRTSAWVFDQRREAISQEKKLRQKETIQLDRDMILGQEWADKLEDDVVPQFKDISQGKHSTKLESEIPTMQQSMRTIAATNRQLAASLVRHSLPKCHPDIFSGDVTMFHPWKNAFRAMIRDAEISPEQEINYLHKYTKGAPQNLVDNFRKRQQNNPSKLLKDLWMELERRFGNSAGITHALLGRLKDAAKFEDKDKKKLQEFADLCADVDYQIEQLPGLTCLNYANVIQPILLKLPASLRNKWEKQVVDYALENHDAYPTFHTFATLMEKQARLKNHPNVVIKEVQRSERKKSTFRNPLEEDTVLKGNVELEDTNNSNQKQCHFHDCKGHTLVECKTFGKKTLQEKIEWLKKAGHCFRCLESKHIAKNCKATVKCEKCGSDRHLVLLHRDKKDKMDNKDDDEEVDSKCTKLCDNNKGGLSCSKIVLLDISLRDKPDDIHRVYALVDEQSNASMITPDLADKLGINSNKEKYFLSTCSGFKEVKFGRRVHGVIATSLNGKSLKLPTLIECDRIPQDKREIATQELVGRFPHLQEIAKEIPPFDPNAEISILIGRDAPELLKVREFKNGPSGAPWAQKLSIGWTVCGQICLDRLDGAVHVSTHRTTISTENGSHNQSLNEAYGHHSSHCNVIRHEFTRCPNTFVLKEVFQKPTIVEDVFHTTIHDNEPALSVEDRRFLEIMDKEVHKNESGNWEMPLPFRSSDVCLPDNREQAMRRFKNLLRSFDRKPQMKRDYFEFMDKLLKRGHAVPLSQVENQHHSHGGEKPKRGKVWYLPHFGVYHPKKPTQIRVVFDSSAEFRGVSLNKELLPGPDVLNSLHGVLIRFRLEDIGIMCDIEQMFHCFHVTPEDRDVLRFLWFDENDPEKEVIEYRMVVHLFGNTCSPAIATYGLRKTADEGEEKYGHEAKMFVKDNFYVDDGLTSCSTPKEAIDLVKKTQAMLAEANLRLHKIVSNSITVMEALPQQDRVTNIRDLDLHNEPLPVQRSLGMYWSLQDDAFTYRVSVSEKPYTRRGVLAVVNSVYDPLGFATPVTLKGKLILRKLVAMGNKDRTEDTLLGWDDPLPANLNGEWQHWRNSLADLENIYIPRCYHAYGFGKVTRNEIHAFSDASEEAVGVAVYLRQTNVRDEVNVSLVFAKAKLAPRQATTIPRLELCAAVLATRAVERTMKDLKLLTIAEVVFYTDSKVVLGYIQNESRRFYVYVANRVQIIRKISKPSQWRYIETSDNPADLATRCTPANVLKSSCWFEGPRFLHDATEITVNNDESTLYDDDPEVRPQVAVHTTDLTVDTTLKSERFTRFSKWSSLRRALANLIVIVRRFRKRRETLVETNVNDPHRLRHPNSRRRLIQPPRLPTSAELMQAELIMIKTVQNESFPTEIATLQSIMLDGKTENDLKKSNLYRLDPFLDDYGVLRVGGRLRRSKQDFTEKHPVILPKGHHLSHLVITHHHERVYHQGRQITSGAIRQAGYWIVGASRMISKSLKACVTCRKLRGKTLTQYMADLPTDRLETPPPFTNVGLDVFGPWIIHTRKLRGGAANFKRWGLVFTCLNSRAIHIEVLETMDASSFICALRRFLSIRGPVSILRCDQGTNFIGGKSELDAALQETELKKIEKYVTEQDCEWLFNPPHASHFGGVWERQIGTIRRVLDGMLHKIGSSQLTHELLVTLMAEVTGIVNCRPIATLPSDTENPQPLTPAMLLTMKTRPLPPPPGIFVHQDLYSRRRWKRAQYLADQFWIRWKNEYLQSLQSRSKWNKRHPNLEIGDIVLMRTDTHRNYWPMGRVIKAIKSEDGKVRKAELSVYRDGERKTFTRPIGELVFLISNQ